MTCRAYGPGWREIHRPDVRRGLWERHQSWQGRRRPPATLELCAGREGDDAHVSLPLARPLTPDELDALHEVLSVYAFAVETGTAEGCYTDNAQRKRAEERVRRARARGLR